MVTLEASELREGGVAVPTYHPTSAVITLGHQENRALKQCVPLKITCVCECMLSHFSHIWLFETLWPTVHQAPLSMGFSRQDYWRGCHAPFQGLLTQGSNSLLLRLLHWETGSTGTTSAAWEVQRLQREHFKISDAWAFFPETII